MNRYVLLILVCLQVNVSNSMEDYEYLQNHFGVDKENNHNNEAARKKQKLMDRLKDCHKYPEETMAVINEVEKKVHNYVGNNLDEEQRANMEKFKDVCNEHIIELMHRLLINKLKNSDIETINSFMEGMADNATWTCYNEFGAIVGVTRGMSPEQWAIGGIAHLVRGHLEDDVFKRMKENLKDERENMKKFFKRVINEN